MKMLMLDADVNKAVATVPGTGQLLLETFHKGVPS